MRIQDLMVKAIERTNNPMAPLIMSQAYGSVGALMKMLRPLAKKEEVEKITKKLLKSWPNEDKLNELCSEPDYIFALCVLLEASLVAMGSKK